MKLTTHIVIGTITTACAVVGILIYLNLRQLPAVLPPKVTAPELSVITATPVMSEVYAAPPSAATFVFSEITAPTQLTSGSHIKTSATGRAIIEGVNTTLLDTNSELTLALLDTEKNQSDFQLYVGSLWARVQKLSDKGEYYEIETHNAHASVRGTSFGIVQDEKSSTLFVAEGVVSFGPTLGPFILVPAGKKAVVVGDSAAIVSDLSAADKALPWFTYNNPRAGIAPPSTKAALPANTVQPIKIDSAEPVPEPISEPTVIDVIDEPITIIEPTPAEPIPVPVVTAPTPKISLSSVSPRSIVEGSTASITLTGTNFVSADASSVMVGTTTITAFTVVNDTTIQFIFDTRGFTAGAYNVTVQDAAGIRSTVRSGLTITQTPASPATRTTIR